MRSDPVSHRRRVCRVGHGTYDIQTYLVPLGHMLMLAEAL